MLYLTCTTISSVDLAQYGVSPAKDWVSVKCGTIYNKNNDKYGTPHLKPPIAKNLGTARNKITGGLQLVCGRPTLFQKQKKRI